MSAFPTQPKPFQRKGIDKLVKLKGRALLADDMGLGKTFQFIRYACENKLFPAIVICPSAVKFNWEIEVSLHSGERTEVLCGRKAQARGKFFKPPAFTVINYDILEGWFDYLNSLEAKLLGLDESHYLGNRASKRSKLVKQLAKGGLDKPKKPRTKRRKRIPHLIAMTGTPFENRPKELFTTVQMLWPKQFPSWLDFGETYCGPTKNIAGKREYNGATRLKKLRKKLKKCGMIRRRKIDVLDELPSKSRTIVPLEIQNKATYNRAEQSTTKWLKLRTQDKQKERMTQFTHLKKLAAELKQGPVQKWIQDFMTHTDEKLVVFGWHKKILKPLYEKWKPEAVLITGKVTGRKRQAAVNAFVNDPKKRLVIGNLAAAGTGINGFQKVCRTAVFIEYGWNPQKHLQAEDRLWRMGQDRGVQIYYLTAKDTVEHKVCQLIQRKNEWFNTAFDGDDVGKDFNLMDMLEKELTA